MTSSSTHRKDFIVALALLSTVGALYTVYKNHSIYVAFWVLAVTVSIFYGAKAASVFNAPAETWSWPQRIHQAWLHFICAFLGWVLAFYLGFMRRPVDTVEQYALITFVLISITGQLPLAVSYFIEGLKDFLPGLRSWTAKTFQKWF